MNRDNYFNPHAVSRFHEDDREYLETYGDEDDAYLEFWFRRNKSIEDPPEVRETPRLSRRQIERLVDRLGAVGLSFDEDLSNMSDFDRGGKEMQNIRELLRKRYEVFLNELRSLA